MKRRAFFLILVFISLCLSEILAQASQVERAAVAADILQRRVVTTQAGYLPIQSAFIASLSSTRVPGGIVTVLGCEANPTTQTQSLPEATLREALDAIVQTDPGYQWQINSGVVNLVPASNEPALLNVRINRLRVKNATSINKALGKLYALPEVRAAIAELQLSEAVRFIKELKSLEQEPSQYSIECEGVTVREALNAIVRAHGRAVWQYKERHCDGKVEFSIDFVVK
jgi:hypothetical protein